MAANIATKSPKNSETFATSEDLYYWLSTWPTVSAQLKLVVTGLRRRQVIKLMKNFPCCTVPLPLTSSLCLSLFIFMSFSLSASLSLSHTLSFCLPVSVSVFLSVFLCFSFYSMLPLTVSRIVYPKTFLRHLIPCYSV